MKPFFRKSLFFVVLFCFSHNVFSIEKTTTGFYWPMGTSSYQIGGDWLEGDDSLGGGYFNGLYHNGVDMAFGSGDASHNKPVYAVSKDCEVSSSVPNGDAWGYDNGLKDKPNHALFLQCKDFDSKDFGVLYGHVQPTVKPGDKIPNDLVIGYIGSWMLKGGGRISGDHLHFGVFPGKSIPPANKDAGYGWGRMNEKYWPPGGTKSDCEAYTDPSSHIRCTNGFVNPVEFIKTHEPKSKEAILNEAAQQGNLNVIDEICRVERPQPEVENFRFWDWWNKVIHWLTFNNERYTYYGNANCDLASTIFAMGGGFGDSDGPSPSVGTPKSGSYPDLKLVETKLVSGNNHDLPNTNDFTFGQEVWFAVKLKSENQGTSKTFTNTLYLSNGEKFDGKDSARNYQETTQGIAKNDTHWEMRRFDQDIPYPGVYVAHAFVDSGNVVTETNEDNNFKRVDGNIFRVRGTVDIAFTGISSNKSEYAPGEQVLVNIAMANIGPHPFSHTSYVDYYIDGTLQVLPEGKERVLRENLRPGVTKYEDAILTLPVYYGAHEIKACFRLGNRDDLVTELNPSNNCGLLNVSVPEPKNLRASDIVFPVNAETNTAFQIGFSGVSEGAWISIPFSVDYYLDGSKVIQKTANTGDVYWGAGLNISSIDMTVATAGVHMVKVCIDGTNAVNETNESDNCAERSFTVNNPPPKPDFVGVGVDFGNEQVIEVDETFTPGFTVRNDGVTSLTLIKIGYYLDGTLVGTDQIQPENLLNADTKRETLEGFSVSTPGQHVLKACADYPSEIPEENEGDNCIEKTFDALAVVWNPGNTASITSCAPSVEADFFVMPTVQEGDVGSAIFGNNRQRIFIPNANLLQMTGFTWNGFAGFDPSLVTRICWNSDATYWGAQYSTACGNGFVLDGDRWIADIPNTPDASKGTWSFVQDGMEYWVNPSSIANLDLDTDGHIRYNGLAPNAVTVADDPSGMMLSALFGTRNVSGFWLPANSTLNGKAFWKNDQDDYPGIPGNLECDANTGKLKVSFSNVAPSSTGRILLGLTAADSYGWQTTNQWMLPVGSEIVNADGDYKLPASASPFKKMDAAYDIQQKKLTLTINGDSRMLDAFFNIPSIDKITTEAWFDTWIFPEGGASKRIKGTVSRSSNGVWTIVFPEVPAGNGGNVYLTLSNGSQSWQDVSKFSFGSGIVVDTAAGNYTMPWPVRYFM